MQRSVIVLALLLGPWAAGCSDSGLPTSSGGAGTVPQESQPAVPAPTVLAEPELQDRGDGLSVELLERGHGEAARRGSEVLVHFTARVDGAEQPFDSTYSRGLPDRWRLSTDSAPRLMEGLVRGVEGLTEGSRAVLRIPAPLGYGSEGKEQAGIPPESTLVYELRLLDVLP